MDIYKKNNIRELITGNPYVGRGVVTGKSADGKKAVFASFIMGRSANSRNRVFAATADGIRTEPFDYSKVQDPSLIIYNAVRRIGSAIIVTNGDQTDTIYDFIAEGKTFEEALDTREFEPDGPNFTPRISAVLFINGNELTYKQNILKSADAEGTACNRYTFSYNSLPGVGHFLHTYITDGAPIPSFCGEPERIAIPDDIDEFTNDLWNGLDEANKISLFVSYTDLETKAEETRLINKYVK